MDTKRRSGNGAQPMALLSDRKAEFETLLQELKVEVLGRTIGAVAAVSEEVEKLAEENLFFYAKPHAYRRLFSMGPPKSDTAPVNHVALFLGSFSFFWHAIDRLSFRPDNDALRAAILDPVVKALSKFLAEGLSSNQATKTTTEEVLASVKSLSLRYVDTPSLLGNTPQDENCALGLAARAIADVTEFASTDVEKHVLTRIVRAQLLESMIRLDLANRIKALETLL